MSHLTLKESYTTLAERLNRFPQGAPPGDLLYRILEVLFTPEEAGLVALLPIRPFTAGAAAEVWKRPVLEARGTLEALASRGMLLDLEVRGEQLFVLPPPMAGFFEFSMMRVGNGYDQKLLAELFHQYLNVEEDFVRELFAGGETQLGRVFVNERALTGPGLSVLDHERAGEVIRTASHMGVGTCYCRHKMDHLGRACEAPMDICMTFGNTTRSLIKHGIARRVDAREGLDLLDKARDHNLVQFGENVREQVAFICNCCGCCCEAMLAAKRFASLHPVATTNYLPRVAQEDCDGCGKCVGACPVEAMGLVSAGDPARPRRMKARVDADLCLGCGVCARVCAKGAIALEARGSRVLTPVNTAHRAVLMAIERGKLQNLIFDNQAHWNHRAMAAILGVVLRLPPVKQVMASRQMKSRYLDRLLAAGTPVHREH
ncbi:4Fe-4S dicluster domain-containing protein [Mesoterricola silvestris]|uniref:(Fe-S)-binding protein n=1 Tax=Mesoterricola silvestris TaxID=2927979 RepID=A0AA48GIP7_9BACT|nr:4Fe-4S dicluster domain-containing protein [Mesoterricola silvestris]BDU72012.1 (Fe-S)-binding protein [Mesoterricola silvestris]